MHKFSALILPIHSLINAVQLPMNAAVFSTAVQRPAGSLCIAVHGQDMSVRCPVTGKRMECRRQAGRGVEQLQWGLSRLEPLGA